MANFLQSRICNSLVAYLTIASFTATLLVPLPVMALDVNAINFGIKMEKIVIAYCTLGTFTVTAIAMIKVFP